MSTQKSGLCVPAITERDSALLVALSKCSSLTTAQAKEVAYGDVPWYVYKRLKVLEHRGLIERVGQKIFLTRNGRKFLGIIDETNDFGDTDVSNRVDIDSVEKAHNEISWLLTKAQLAADCCLESVLRSVHPKLIGIEKRFEAQVIESPIRALRIFVTEYPPRLKVVSAPLYAKEIGYAQIRDYWFSLIMQALKSASLVNVPQFETALVSFSFSFADKKVRDPDRYAAMFIMDILTWAGVLRNDDYKNVVLQFACQYDPKSAGTEIVIADLFGEAQNLVSGLFHNSKSTRP